MRCLFILTKTAFCCFCAGLYALATRSTDTSALTVLLSLQVSVLVLAHTRELAFQISKEYERFSKYSNNVKIAVFFGGMIIKKDEEVLKKNCPHIVVGTPGRILALARSKVLSLKHVKHFILDECDKMLAAIGEFSFFQLNMRCSISFISYSSVPREQI